MERYELAKNRIMELETEIDGAFGDYIKEAAHLFVTIFHVMDGTEDAKQRKEWNAFHSPESGQLWKRQQRLQNQ